MEAKALMIRYMRVGLLATLVFCGLAQAAERNPRQYFTVMTIGDNVLIGSIFPVARAEWNFRVASLTEPKLSCRGRLEFMQHGVVSKKGRGRYNCDNDLIGRLRSKSETVIQGSAKGKSEMGTVQLIYGHTLEKINERMDFPNGASLVVTDAGGFALQVVRTNAN